MFLHTIGIVIFYGFLKNNERLNVLVVAMVWPSTAEYRQQPHNTAVLQDRVELSIFLKFHSAFTIEF